MMRGHEGEHDVLLMADEVKMKHPQLLIAFYEKHISWNESHVKEHIHGFM